ncbi:hypothetical protein V8F33_001486 [Rhypophila sp. PSN 637]
MAFTTTSAHAAAVVGPYHPHLHQQSSPVPAPVHNSSHCHPVFFTDKLRAQQHQRIHVAQQQPQPQAINPVAHGYIYQDTTSQRPSRL